MAKDPAFLFYSSDWITGTADMLQEEKGIYIDLLAYQHINGSLPADTKRLSLLVRMTEKEFIPLWENIKSHFIQMDNQMVNQRLKEVITERREYAKKLAATGTFASQVKKIKDRKKIVLLKQSFDVKQFMLFEKKEIKEKVIGWVNQMVIQMDNNLEDVDEDVNKEVNNKGNSKKKENNNKEVFDYKNIHKKIPDDVYEHYTNAQVKERTVLLANEMVQSDEWMVSVARLMNRTPQIALKKVKEFLRMIEVSRECFDTLSGVKKHFSRWIKYNLNEKV